TAFVFPLQITMAKRHKDSAVMFFNEWEKWVKDLQGFDIKITFLWISPNDPSTMENDETVRTLRGRIVRINPSYTSRNIHVKDVDKVIWDRYTTAKADK